ncbi:hypothetical protein [Hyphomicrobium sp. CS1GBMeth3]|uniref:hypothetical protein n=1 Tax=Hyphomicrobium sp. CS1GBMeth3 TaxID=1892845 RepID=UPI000931A520|nr:hypothetical protein [Hyphomicrobium sp. CS1GBMeth3]
MSLNQHGRPYAPGISLRPLLPWLLLASALGITMMVLGAGRGDRVLPSLSAGLLIAFVVGTGLGVNAPLWSKSTGSAAQPDGLTSIREALRCNVWLAALVYAWGASALFAIYSLSDLVWRHAFQYASGAAVFAAGIGLYALWLGRSSNRHVPPLALTIVHGIAAAGGLAYLIGADKLATVKGDWAANEVFLWGSLAIVALCIMSLVTQTRIKA